MSPVSVPIDWNLGPDCEIENDLIQTVLLSAEVVECEVLGFINCSRRGSLLGQFQSLISDYLCNIHHIKTDDEVVDISFEDCPYPFEIDREPETGSEDPRYILELLTRPELAYLNIVGSLEEAGAEAHYLVQAGEKFIQFVHSWHQEGGGWGPVQDETSVVEIQPRLAGCIGVIEPLEEAAQAAVEAVPVVDPEEYGEQENPLDHSRFLDVHTWSDHPEVNAFVDEIYQAVFKGGNAKIRKKHLKVVLLDLYVTWCDDPDLKIAYHRNRNRYRAGSRYNALHISHKTINVVDQLDNAGLVQQWHGFNDRRKGGSSRISRMAPTEALVGKFENARFGPLDIGHHEDRECIILRQIKTVTKKNKDGTKYEKDVAEDIQYADTAKTRRMRKSLQSYNALLQKTFIDIPTLANNWIDPDPNNPLKQNRVHVNQKEKFVRRIFNRGSFRHGGRFFGGWWQRCPKEWREKIFLNDVPISEIDYSGLHIVMLYAEKEINYWEAVGKDPYLIDVPDFLDTPEEARQCAKDLMLVALNAKNENSAFAAYRADQPTGSYEKKFKNEQLTVVLDNMKDIHREIADRIASDAGISLMRDDSDIAEMIIKEFTAREIPILTIHDSFLVPYGFEKVLKSEMERAFEKCTRVPGIRMKTETKSMEEWKVGEPLFPKGGIQVYPADFGERFTPKRSGRYSHMFEQFKLLEDNQEQINQFMRLWGEHFASDTEERATESD